MVAIPPAFLLPTPRQVSPARDVHLTLAGYHPAFVVLAIFETKTLEFVPCGICISDCQSVVLGGDGGGCWDGRGVGSFDVGGIDVVCRGSRPAGGAESRGIENGVVDIDQAVADAVFDCGEVGGA